MYFLRFFPALSVIMVLLRLVHYGRFVNLILYYRNAFDELQLSRGIDKTLRIAANLAIVLLRILFILHLVNCFWMT